MLKDLIHPRLRWAGLLLVLSLGAALPTPEASQAQGEPGARPHRAYLPLASRTLAMADLPPVIEGMKDRDAIEAGATWVMYGDAVGNVTAAKGNHRSMGDALLLEERKELWLATGTNVVVWDLETGSHRIVYQGLPAALLSDDDDNVWIGTYGEGLKRLSLRTGSLDTIIETSRTWCLDKDKEGNVWVCDTAGVKRLSTDGRVTGQWLYQAPFNGERYRPVWDVAMGRAGESFAVTGWFDGAIVRLHPDGTETLFYKADDAVLDVAVDLDGSVWAGTQATGLLHLDPDGGLLEAYRAGPDGLASDMVLEIAIAEDGTKWFGTDAGLSRLDVDGAWHAYTSTEGLPGNEVRAITFGANGDLWLGTSGGLAQLPADHVDRPPSEVAMIAWPTNAGALLERHGNDAVRDAEGDMWFALDGDGGVAHLDSSNRWLGYTRENTDGGLVGNTVNAILRHRDGSLWFATRDGLSRRSKDGDWTAFTEIDGLVSNDCRVLAQDLDGSVWVGTDRGLSVVSADGSVRPMRRDVLYVWYRDGSVGVDLSPRLDDQQIRHRFAVPAGRTPDDIVDIVIGPYSRPAAWYGDGTYTSGSSADLASVFNRSDAIRFPAGKSLVDVVAVERSGADETLVWYRDGTMSGGSRTDLTRMPSSPYTVPGGKSAGDVVDVAIDSDERVYAWYRDGTMSVGDYLDLGKYQDPIAARLAPGKSPDDIVGIGFLRPTRVHAMTVDGHGSLWVVPATPDGTENPGKGVRRLTPDYVLSSYSTENGMPSSLVRVVGTSPEGNAWAASAGWLTTFAPDGTIIDRQEASRVVRRLWGDDGAFWTVAWSGVTRQGRDGRAEAWSFDDTPSGLFLPRSAALGADGEIWIPTADGLHQLRLQGVGDRCSNAFGLGMSESVGTSIETGDDVDVFRFEVDQPFSTVEVIVTDPEHRLEVLRTCEDNNGNSIGASSGTGRHIAPSSFEGFEHRHQYILGEQTGPQYIAIRARPGMYDGSRLDYRVRVSIAYGAPVDQTRTLILTHKPRMQVNYDATPEAWRHWEDQLNALARHPEVRGRVITDMLDDQMVDPRVVVAYRNWHARPRHDAHSEAQALADAVRDWLLDLKAEMPFLSYVVIAGDDNIIPFMRVQIEAPAGDSHGWEREWRYMADPPPLDRRSRTGSALVEDYTLSDDVYAMSSKVPWGEAMAPTRGSAGPIIDLPQLSVGRLVETPADMVHAIETFIARDGILTLDRSVVAGYGFMEDGPALGDAYLGRFGGVADDRRQRLMGDEHRLEQWRDAILRKPFDLLFFAAHAKHYLHETPGNGILRAQDILSAEQDFAGRLIYGLACHAGLNVPGDGAEHAEPVDFPEAWSRRGATYIGSTGWAYGFDGALQYQEDLMAEFTRYVTARGGMSVGAALTKAKREYYWDMGELNHFHAKTLAATVLYGLPMYRLATTEVPPDFTESDWVTWGGGDVIERLAPNLAMKRQSLSVRPGAWQQVSTADGDYFELVGRRPRPEAGQPVQPRLRWPRYTESVLVEGRLQPLEPRSAVWLGGSFIDHAGFRPWVVGAGTMGRLHETTRVEVFDAPGWYPSLPVRLRTLPPESSRLHEGNEGQVVLTLGQYDSITKTERMYSGAEVAVYYGASADIEPPSIDRVLTRAVGDRLEVAVEAHDASTILGVYVTWTSGSGKDGTGQWQSEYVAAPTGGAWRVTVPRDAIALVQVVDRAGNVAVADNVGAFYRLTTTE